MTVGEAHGVGSNAASLPSVSRRSVAPPLASTTYAAFDLLRADDLGGRLRDVLAYAATAFEELGSYGAYWDEGEDVFVRQQDKVIAEALLLAYLASRLPDDRGRPAAAIEAVCEAAEPHVTGPRTEALLRRFPQTAVSLGLGQLLLSQFGRGDREIERLVRASLEAGFTTISERSAFRMMDTRWAFGLFAPEAALPVEELLPYTTLASFPSAIYTTRTDEYAVTHALFFLTDFGRRPLPSQLSTERTQALIDEFLAWNATRGDLDLLGEFLMCALMVRKPISSAFRFAWDVFFRAWESEGSLVGPNYSAERIRTLPPEEAAARAFAENYHTTFIGGMLCAIALALMPVEIELASGARTAPPEDRDLGLRCAKAAAAARNCVEGPLPALDVVVDTGELLEWVVGRLLAVQREDSSEGEGWLQAMLRDPLPRHDVTPVLYRALLVAAARSYFLSQLAEALAIGVRNDLMDVPTFRAALRFLLDQQRPNGLVGVHTLALSEENAEAASTTQSHIAAYLLEVATALERS